MDQRDNETSSSAEKAAALSAKWDQWDKKQKRDGLWQIFAGASAVLGLVVLAAHTGHQDRPPECPADMDATEVTTPSELRNAEVGNVIKLKDGSTCEIRFTP